MNKESLNKNLCISCNNEEGYYPIDNEIIIYIKFNLVITKIVMIIIINALIIILILLKINIIVHIIQLLKEYIIN